MGARDREEWRWVVETTVKRDQLWKEMGINHDQYNSSLTSRLQG